MRYFYSLRIDVEKDKSLLVDEILNVSHNMANLNWGLEKIIGDDDMAFDFIGYFTDILKDNYDKLRDIGIEREDIAIWMLYEYDQQCNMEFSPKELSEIGNEGITLCISCWDS